MEVKNYSHLTAEEFETFRSELENHHSLQDLLRWAESQPAGALVPGVIANLVIQDEFTHDLVVPWHGSYVVYGTT